MDSSSQAFDVQRLDPSRYRAVGAMLARAFDADPVWRYAYPDARWREPQLAWLFEQGARLTAPVGECYVTSNLEGAAFWFPPEHAPEVDSWRAIHPRLLYGFWLIGMKSIVRNWGIYADVLERHHREIDGPHWVLDTLGVDPAHQRRGVARALLQPVLDRADAAGIPSYVITHNPVNVPVYERFGFRVVNRDTVRGRGLFVCSLRRPARLQGVA